jgi:hypothetical protein
VTAMEPTPVVETDAPPTASRWEDYVDVFFAPADLFRRRATDRIGPPLLTLLGLAVLFYFVLLPANRMVMSAAVSDNPEAVQAIGQFGTLFQVIGGVFVPVSYLVMIAAAAALLWLTGRISDVRADFSRTMLIATYAAFIYLVAQLASGLAVLLHGEVGLDMVRHTSFGLLRFLDYNELNPVLVALARRVDVFAIWQAAIWGVGMAVIYRTSRLHAAGLAATTWLLFALPGIIGAALGMGSMPGAG